MNKKATIIAVVLFGLIVVGMFVASYILKQKVNKIDQQPTIVTEEVVAPVRINGVHTFLDGKHTVLAELETNSTCALVESRADVTKGTPDRAVVNLSIVERDNAGCEKKPTTRRFIISFEAGKDAKITATIDSKEAILNLVEQDPSKTLNIDDDFFFKG